MPELPEVQTIIDDLKKVGLINKIIQRVDVFWPKSIVIPDLETFCHQLNQKRILDIQRRGKYILFRLDHALYLCLHLRMTGHLLMRSQTQLPPPYVRLQLVLDEKQILYFIDTRKFGKWYLVSDPQDIVGKMGPEPLDPLQFTELWFEKQLLKRSRYLKPLLLDQTFLAGLGNIYVDEALWEAQLHPLQPANKLSKIQIKALYHAIVNVLKRGIDNQGTTLGTGQTNYYRLDGTKGKHQTILNVFRRNGLPCPRCQTTIMRLIVGQRGTHICPTCQHLKS